MANTQLWGDCHTHSMYSDGLFSVEEMTPFFEAFGNDFRIQTDHLLVAVPAGRPAGEWLHAARWSEDYCAACLAATTSRHVCVPGAELGWAPAPAAGTWFHTKIQPPQRQGFPDVSFFGGLEYTAMLAKTKDAGCRPIIAHIDQGAPLAQLSGAEICGLEVRGDIEETRPLLGRPSLKHWDRMLAAGHRVSLSSGSDAHQPDLWAGSGLRTVLLDAPRDAEAIAAAVAAGRSYLSGTWHADCYAAAGWPETTNTVAGGPTHFLPWWEFKRYPLLAGRPAREVVIEMSEAALRDGRCRRDDYPVLLDFTVDGACSGGEVAARAKSAVHASWRTHVPLHVARVVVDGAVGFEVPPSHPAFGKTEGELHVTLDLRGRHYARLELEALAPGDPQQRETLMANPVYVVN